MPNTASAAKQARKSLRQHERNSVALAQIRSVQKRFSATIASGNKEQAKQLHPQVVSVLDKAVKRGLLHRNAANRRKSRMAAQLRQAA